MGFILLLGLFTSCDNDDLEGLGKGANGSFSGDKLALTYSGVPMQGKQATFYTSDGKKATIRLAGLLDLSTLFPSAGIPSVAMMVPGVVPGEVETDLKNVPLTLSADGNSYTFEGTDQKNGRELTYKGEVSANKCIECSSEDAFYCMERFMESIKQRCFLLGMGFQSNYSGEWYGTSD